MDHQRSTSGLLREEALQLRHRCSLLFKGVRDAALQLFQFLRQNAKSSAQFRSCAPGSTIALKELSNVVLVISPCRPTSPPTRGKPPFYAPLTTNQGLA